MSGPLIMVMGHLATLRESQLLLLFTHLIEFLHFDIQSTGRNHIMSTPSDALFFLFFLNLYFIFIQIWEIPFIWMLWPEQHYKVMQIQIKKFPLNSQIPLSCTISKSADSRHLGQRVPNPADPHCMWWDGRQNEAGKQRYLNIIHWIMNNI